MGVTFRDRPFRPGTSPSCLLQYHLEAKGRVLELCVAEHFPMFPEVRFHELLDVAKGNYSVLSVVGAGRKRTKRDQSDHVTALCLRPTMLQECQDNRRHMLRGAAAESSQGSTQNCRIQRCGIQFSMAFFDLSDQHFRPIRGRSERRVGDKGIRCTVSRSFAKLKRRKPACSRKSKSQNVEIGRRVVVAVAANFDQRILRNSEIPVYAQIGFDKCDGMVQSQSPNRFDIDSTAKDRN